MKIEDIDFIKPSQFGSNVPETIIDFYKRINYSEFPQLFNPKKNYSGKVFYISKYNNDIYHNVLIIIDMSANVLDSTTLSDNDLTLFKTLNHTDLNKILDIGKFPK